MYTPYTHLTPSTGPLHACTAMHERTPRVYVIASANLGMEPGASEKAEDEDAAWSAEPVDYDLQVWVIARE